MEAFRAALSNREFHFNFHKKLSLIGADDILFASVREDFLMQSDDTLLNDEKHQSRVAALFEFKSDN